MTLVPVPDQLEPTPTSPVRALLVAFAGLDDQRKALREAGDLDALARGLVDLKSVAAELRTLIRDVEGDCFDLMPAKQHTIPGVGTLERRYATDRKAWDWRRLNDDAFRACVERHEGSLTDAFSELVNIYGLTASHGPRVKPLRDLGLDPDDYCEASPGKRGIQIHGEVQG